MNMMRNVWLVCAGLSLTAAIPMVGLGQEFYVAEGIGGPLTASPVLNAPFSADATTTVRLTFRDGTKLEQSTTARYYRDRVGRARVELLMNGLASATTMFERHIRTIIRLNPDSRVVGDRQTLVRTLDAETRTVHLFPRFMAAAAAGGSWLFAVPIGGVRFVSFRRARDLLTSRFPDHPVDPDSYVERNESLGSRRIADVDTIGSRVTMTIPVGYWRNEKPIALVDERWESAELKLLIAGYFSDSRTGEVEYRLANIRRVESPPDLFVVPEDYTVDHTRGGRTCEMAAHFYTAQTMRCGRAP